MTTLNTVVLMFLEIFIIAGGNPFREPSHHPYPNKLKFGVNWFKRLLLEHATVLELLLVGFFFMEFMGRMIWEVRSMETNLVSRPANSLRARGVFSYMFIDVIDSYWCFSLYIPGSLNNKCYWLFQLDDSKSNDYFNKKKSFRKLLFRDVVFRVPYVIMYLKFKRKNPWPPFSANPPVFFYCGLANDW